MSLKRIAPWILGALIGFLIGFIADKPLDIIVATTLLGFLVGGIYRATIFKTTQKSSLDFIHEILALVSIVLTKDKKILQSELNYVKRFLNHNFSPEDAQKYLLIFREYTQKNLSIIEICERINYELDTPGTRQVMHLVIGAAVADREISKYELRLLFEIGSRLGIAQPTIKSLLSMYSFTFKGAKSNQKQSQAKSNYKNSISNSLSKAYKILELNKNATEKQIKKAYRKLVVLYHPDKVLHMGDNFKMGAKEKFQKLQDAYEQIKSARNIN